MRPDDATQGLVLRREPFGGILFDPARGTHVEVDVEGFELLRDWLSGARLPATPEERAFVESVRGEVPGIGPALGRLRCRDELPEMPPRRYATVLSSPSLVDLQVTRRCRMGCPHCYASSQPDGAHMAFADVARLLEEIARAGVCQLAIGGGEPLLHPDIVPILERAHALGLVPNLTTNGEALTPRVLDTMARCCGAVALSLEGVGDEFARRRRAGFGLFESSLRSLRAHGVRSVLQVTLSAENLPQLGSIVDYCLSCPQLYGVIFLAYKSVGRGERYDTPLSAVPPQELYPLLRGAFMRLTGHTRVGYDCCLTPGIAGIDVELGLSAEDTLEGCSAARTSVGVTTSLDVVPCTFLTHRPLGNLRERSFMEIWRGREAEAFRERLDALGDSREACRRCRTRPGCLGGCPEWDLVRCGRSP